RGARPATAEQALAARRAVVAVSLRCAGQACLQRSIAAALLCRSRGVWPTWCTGVRTSPFEAHAWIEAAGEPVGEPYPAGHYRPLLSVAPVAVQRS
ncbi:MAG: lasso peptide biosynthesis B2 protein, partial [Streptomyces sp.]|nr:lasso peptide biosynthesis B2 protein [Streptomyces sp.]